MSSMLPRKDSVLEVADEFALRDEDSTFGGSDHGIWDDTTSLGASIYEYERIYGRTFHAYHAGKYFIPNDPNEQERIDVKYHGVHLALDAKLLYAPIEDPRAILDIGTGTGIWALDTADAYPDATIIGTDLSPI